MRRSRLRSRPPTENPARLNSRSRTKVVAPHGENPTSAPASQILRDQLEVAQRSPAFRAGRRKRLFEAVAHVIVYQGLFGAFNGAFHGLQLLGDLSARPALLDHFNDGFEMAVGTFQTSGNRGMRVVHEILLTSWEDNNDPPGRIRKNNLTAIKVRHTCQALSRTRPKQRLKPCNPTKEHMGSTSFGNVTPSLIGSALPQDIKINRAGFRRVRGDGRA